MNVFRLFIFTLQWRFSSRLSEGEGWEGRNEDRQGKKGQGGGVAECHPVIGESARLFSELGVWIERGSSGRNKPTLIYTRLSSSERCQSDSTEEKRSLVGKRHKSYTAFYPKAKAIHRSNQLYLIATRWCNNERCLPPTGLHFLFFHTREMRL